jgi:NADPH2 dehydrogenase
MNALQPYTLKSITLKNRIVMPPMCMYQATDGQINAFHRAHYATRAMGQVGFIIVEATAVTPEGRITDHDLGLWSDDHIAGFKQLVDEVHAYGAKIGIQLQHAGRKSTSSSIPHLAPSAIPFSERFDTPNAMTQADIDRVIDAFRSAAIRANQAGFDAIELHGAHGYLINEFLSPLSNHRTDAYGGSLENRGRFLRELVDAITPVWPQEKLFQIRVTAEEYHPDGNHPQDVIDHLKPVASAFDLIHVSSGGLVNVSMSPFPLYQVEFAKQIKRALNKPVIAVGLITTPQQVEDVLKDIDLVALGRELLRHPYWVNAAYAADHNLEAVFESYRRGYQ